MKRDIKKALGASLKAEEKSFKDRFEKAETVLGEKPANKPTVTPKAKVQAKVIRDSFTIPSSDYDLIPTIKKRCMKAGIGMTKSEILRAGLLALYQLSEKELVQIAEKVEKVKPGRPQQSM